VSQVPERPPDEPDTRTNTSEAASDNGKVVQPSTWTMPGQPPDLALERDILRLFVADLHRAGVAGEERLAQLEYLALTSRMLPWSTAERPVSILAKGSSSTGKSHTTQTVLRFFPQDAWIDLGSMSRRYLLYTEEAFAHRFLIVPEWATIKEDEEIVSMLRVLLSEGRLIHGTVEGEGTRKPKRIEKKGPTGLIITTTEAAVDVEMETRCLSLVTDDTPEQTRRVYDTIAALEFGGETVDLKRWHELQTWIAGQGETRVVIPFVSALAELMPAGATRLRRDFVSLLCLVRAHAVLHQARRERDHRGRVVADVELDYASIRNLVGDVLAEGVEASVTAAMRETVEAVEAVVEKGHEHTSPKAVADRLGVGRSATYDRIRRALLAGYLVNEADRDERGMKLAVGAPLPGAETFLPTPADVVRVMSEGIDGHDNTDSVGTFVSESGCPACPGGEGFPELVLAPAVLNGHITEAEAEEGYILHKLIAGVRDAY
jgi:hypothetical protein